MIEYLPANEIPAGRMVVDPGTGLWCQLHESQTGPAHTWLLWGSPRPPGSLGCRVHRDQRLVCREKTSLDDIAGGLAVSIYAPDPPHPLSDEWGDL